MRHSLGGCAKKCPRPSTLGVAPPKDVDCPPRTRAVGPGVLEGPRRPSAATTSLPKLVVHEREQVGGGLAVAGRGGVQEVGHVGHAAECNRNGRRGRRKTSRGTAIRPLTGCSRRNRRSMTAFDYRVQKSPDRKETAQATSAAEPFASPADGYAFLLKKRITPPSSKKPRTIGLSSSRRLPRWYDLSAIRMMSHTAA